MEVYTLREVPQTGWVAQGANYILVTLTTCDQNLTGTTFVNILMTSEITPMPGVALGTAGATPTITATVSSGLTPSPFPLALPRTGDDRGPDAALVILLGWLLFVAGVAMRRRRT